MFQTKSVEKINTHILCTFFFSNRYVYEIMCKNRVKPDSPQMTMFWGADKSLAQQGRKQATAAEDFDFHISYL
jgi:hypothetical protein